MNQSKKTKMTLAAAVLLLTFVCHAQPAKEKMQEKLQVSQEFMDVGQKLFEGFDFMFENVSEYVHNNEHITKAGMDSVRQGCPGSIY